MKKKKAAKKKAARKKAARKKTGKKVTKRRPPKKKPPKKKARKRKRKKKPVKPTLPSPPPKVITITGRVPDDEHAHGRVFRWHSNDDDYTLTFNRRPSSDPNPWPFNQPPDQSPNKIIVPAGNNSGTFTVRSTAKSLKGYGYRVDPPATPPRPGPEVVPDP